LRSCELLGRDRAQAAKNPVRDLLEWPVGEARRQRISDLVYDARRDLGEFREDVVHDDIADACRARGLHEVSWQDFIDDVVATLADRHRQLELVAPNPARIDIGSLSAA